MSHSIFKINHPANGLQGVDLCQSEALKMAQALIMLSDHCKHPVTLCGLSAAHRVIKANKQALCALCGDEVSSYNSDIDQAPICEDCRSDFDSQDLEDKLEQIVS